MVSDPAIKGEPRPVVVLPALTPPSPLSRTRARGWLALVLAGKADAAPHMGEGMAGQGCARAAELPALPPGGRGGQGVRAGLGDRAEYVRIERSPHPQENCAMTSSPTLPNREAAPAIGAPADGALTAEKLAALRATFDRNPAYRLAQNAVTQVTVDDVALNRRVVTGIDHTFSHLLDDWPVTNQKTSGRCWMFAGLNLFRVGAMRLMNLKEFEFSQSYSSLGHKTTSPTDVRCHVPTRGAGLPPRSPGYPLGRHYHLKQVERLPLVRVGEVAELVPQGFAPYL